MLLILFLILILILLFLGLLPSSSIFRFHPPSHALVRNVTLTATFGTTATTSLSVNFTPLFGRRRDSPALLIQQASGVSVLREETLRINAPVAALLAVLLAGSPAWTQTPYGRPVQESVGSPDAEPIPAPASAPTSRWLTAGPGLCDVPVAAPPIAAEVYFQSGWSIPTNSWFNKRDVLGRDMNLGFVVQGGVRTLFFNQPATRAWVVDTSISHHSNGHDQDVGYPLRVIDFTGNTDITGQPEVKLIQFGTPTRPPIEIRDTDRTYVNVGVGRNYYWNSSAETECWHMRWGWDIGGRYGALSQEYDLIKHRTDVIGGFFVGVPLRVRSAEPLGHAHVRRPRRVGVHLERHLAGRQRHSRDQRDGDLRPALLSARLAPVLRTNVAGTLRVPSLRPTAHGVCLLH